ncbi:hypothetical protein JOC34_000569 [Virgibacillus halotolerans]|uniref:hypothetical protein n=1 Tax=Virgibacillus halotolerans TaxID=1071053 RepID=UPI00196128D0|nr:hypothetical protein [Virgibacillus halotolerans]MBM7598212.1 hypothetical protein [Virgibacillus halotolerans]
MRSLLNKGSLAILMLVLSAVVLSACLEETSQDKETGIQQNTYTKLSEKEPAKEMTNPKTRETINFFTDTWNKKDQLAYVYLQNSDGDMIGYYVLDGPPVSMCTSLTPNFRVESGSNGKVVTPAPGTDGVYRGEEDCSRYYAKDATSGAYVEFTVGMGINMLLYTEPLTNHPNVQSLSPEGE